MLDITDLLRYKHLLEKDQLEYADTTDKWHQGFSEAQSAFLSLINRMIDANISSP